MATKRKDVHLKASKNAPKKKKFDENANYLYVFDVRGTNIRKNNQAVRIPNNATTIEELREGISHVFPNIPKNQFKIILFGGKKNDNFEYHMHQPQHRNELVEKLICPRHRGWLICCDAAWRQSQYNDHHERSHKAEEKAEIKTTEDVKKIKDSMVIFVSTEPEEENEKIGEELAVKNDNTRMDYSS
uniref:Uncharacterized protein n=1 Tax=Panagrolaimus sp. JU765 TaxID=591449 RepID=A0AC34RQL5_9BILA